MKIPNTIACCIAVAFLFQPPAIRAENKKVCGVEAISRDTATESFSVEFDGKMERHATVKRKDGTLDMERKEKILKNESKFLRKVIGAEGEVVYVARGKNEGCVIRGGERDGKKGFYIEWHETALNLPPQNESVFIEAN